MVVWCRKQSWYFVSTTNLTNKTNPIVGFNERQRSPNETNLVKTHNILLLANLCHSKNACVHGLAEFICFIGLICCSTIFPLNEWAVYLHHKKHSKSNIGRMSGTRYGRTINAEFSLQSASQNSHENHQQQSWSQIREKWARFIICWYLQCYAFVVTFLSYFHRFLAVKALR